MAAERRKRDRGFTLPELLVTIAVMGVLAAISIPAFVSQAEKSRQAGAAADAAAIAALVTVDIESEYAVPSSTTPITSYNSLAGMGRAKVSEGSSFTLQTNAGEVELGDGTLAFCLEVTNADDYVAVAGNCSGALLSPAADWSAIGVPGYAGSWDAVINPYLVRFREDPYAGKYGYVSESTVLSLISDARSYGFPMQALGNGGIRLETTAAGVIDVFLLDGGAPADGGQIVAGAVDLLN